MSAERRVTVSAATARARTHHDDAVPAPGTRPAERSAAAAPEAPGSGPPDADPLDTDPPGSLGVPHVPGSPGSVAAGGAAVSALIRRQLGIALRTCAIVVAVVAGLPALLALSPAVARAGVSGVPLAWLVLVFGIQPLWVAVALRQLSRAERAERELTGPVTGRGPLGRR
ncbi:hypothetical protein [Actinomadura sp. 3N508]|uniref:hypothetical protein n=1 Tax=Actinomadura sp. 3N508 TaxID=3375153 RepID=UPI0037A7EE63